MRRQVDHHLARARAVGRRAGGPRARRRGGERRGRGARGRRGSTRTCGFDIAGANSTYVAIERQDLDEILGNLIENAAKYGGGSVFVTVDAEPGSTQCEILDRGRRHRAFPTPNASRCFDRGARLDTGKPGTGLGLAIVRDVAEIYGGTVELDESEDLGGLLVKLRVPRAARWAGRRLRPWSG